MLCGEFVYCLYCDDVVYVDNFVVLVCVMFLLVYLMLMMCIGMWWVM